MTTTPVTPIPGVNAVIASNGVTVIAVAANPNGGYIVNPATAADQGLGSPEPLYVDPILPTVPLAGNGTTVRLEPGQSYELIPGQSTPTYANAATGGHKFTVVSW